MTEMTTEKSQGPPADVSVPISTADAPPSYEATSKDAPPTYNSIYGKLKDAKEKNSNPVSFLGAIFGILMGTLCMTIFLAIALAIPITMIVIGALYKDDCPADRMIPIYLIVMGSFYIVKSLIDMLGRAKKSRLPEEEKEDYSPSRGESGLSGCIGLFLFAFFIAGNVFIYRIYAPNTSDPSLDDYCDPTLYYFAFWVTTATYIAMGVACCCFCTVACVAGCCSAGRE